MTRFYHHVPQQPLMPPNPFAPPPPPYGAPHFGAEAGAAPGAAARETAGTPPPAVDPAEAARSMARLVGLDPESMAILERAALAAQKEILAGLQEVVERRLAQTEAARPRARTIVVE